MGSLKIIRNKMSLSLDCINLINQLEYIHSKHTGTGNSETSQHDWCLHIRRDSYSSYIGHYSLASYIALVRCESIGRTNFEFMQHLILPCGFRPDTKLALTEV